jgi:hypothetical protein
MSHFLDDSKGSNAKDSGIGCSRFGLNFDGGEVLRVNLYLARCAPTARYGVISTASLGGELTRAFTSSVRIGRGIDLHPINPIEATNLLHSAADCSSDEFALFVGIFGREFVPERHESGDFALWGIVKDLGIANLWGFLGLW